MEPAHIAVGVARVDNRDWLAQQAGCAADCTDLELILRFLVRRGTEAVRDILGDFAFVLWEQAGLVAVAACDALGLRKLYYARHRGLLSFASRAEALSRGDRYDRYYLAERLATAESDGQRTVYEGVRAVPAGTAVVLSARASSLHRYWSPDQLDPLPIRTGDPGAAAATLRQLVLEAVACRLDGDGATWSQLSGGLDSASVVGAAQWLAQTGRTRCPLGGTVTYVDRQGTEADERRFSTVVVQHWRVRNEVVLDPPLWADDRFPVPHLDQPRGTLMHYPREYRLWEAVTRGGGRVLLTGQGPDEYLRGNMFFFADWIARGHPLAAVKEMVRRSAIGRVSFWELAYLNAVLPLLPTWAQRRWRPGVSTLPPWIPAAVVREFELDRRGLELGMYSGPRGSKYRTRGVAALQRTTGHLVLDDLLDVRHPFLDRRLVEFGLQLPPELVVQPYAGKWLLREAMRGLVPEEIRTRVGKGSTVQLYAWYFQRHHGVLEPLLEQPILGDLGLIDGKALRKAFLEVRHQPQRRDDPHTHLQHVLALEAWLQNRAGRWPREHRPVTEVSTIDRGLIGAQ
jgi:asparagine synthase (glutamine-hydrolysing)